MEILKQKDNDATTIINIFFIFSLYKNNNIDFEENKVPERFGECFFFWHSKDSETLRVVCINK